MTELRTRRPTGAAPWPRVLLSGEEGTDGAWMAAAFTADDRLGTTYWLELNPGATGDIYGSAPGADFDLLDHDGTWAGIYDQLDAAWSLARAAAEEKNGVPAALVVNGMSAEWAMLSRLADLKARRRTAAALLDHGLDPDAAFSSEVKVEIDPDLWTLIGQRHSQFMGKILTWPGPVILIAREKRTSDGRWSLKTQEQLGFDCTAWVRLTRTERPEIVSLLTPRGRLTSSQRRTMRTQFTLVRLVWEWSGVAAATPMPAVRVLDADQVMPGEEAPVRVQVTPARHTRTRTTARQVIPPPATEPEAGAPQSVDASTEAVVVAEVEAWLALDQRGKVGEQWHHTIGLAEAVQAVDVAGLLTADQHDALETKPGAVLTLKSFGEKTGRWVTKTGTSLRSPYPVGVA